MDWKDVSESHGDYYFRWIMSVKLERDAKDKPAGRTTGISHVRFGADGKVIFHQDYFDGAAFCMRKYPSWVAPSGPSRRGSERAKKRSRRA